MSGGEASTEPAKKLTLEAIFMKIENLRLWNHVRSLAIRGTVDIPGREPWGTAIPGLFDVIEENNGDGVVALLEAVGKHDLADQVRLMLKTYEQVLLPMPK
jgi:hypothetical protein